MRILMLTDYFPPHTGGGVERVAFELGTRLARRGHLVSVLTIRTCPGAAVECEEGLQISRIPGTDLTRRLGLQQAASLRVPDTIARSIRSFKPDVVHAHNLFFRTTEAAAFLRSFHRVPLVTTVHLGQQEGGGRLFASLVRAYESTIGRFIIRRSDHTIAVSEAVAAHVRHLGGHRVPITVIPNGVDTEVFAPSLNGTGAGPVILFVGRLVPNKGPDTLLRAAPAILAQNPQATFIMVGDGPLRNRLAKRAKDLSLDSTVHFLGIRHDVPDLMRQATIMVRPSTTEGMPLTVLEAMASGLPIVATPAGGTPEIVHNGVTGFIVPAGDEDALATRINDLLAEPGRAAEMGRRGREIARTRHSWDAVAAATESVYTEVTGRR